MVYGHLTGLMALRDRLMTDAALNGLFLSAYNKEPVHFVGLKSSFAATDYPYLCYVPNTAKRGEMAGDIEVISVLIGVYDKTVNAGVSLGAINLAMASEAVVKALPSVLKNGAAVTWLGTVSEATDLQVAHPLYQKEIQIPLRVRML